MRLDRFLIKTANGPRKVARRLIFSGRVTVNGEVVTSPAHHIDPSKDVVEVDGKRITYIENVYLILYKPVGYVTSTSDPEHPTVMDLVEGLPFVGPIFPAGRLDLDAEGLVFLTSDGQLAHRLMHPRYHVPRTYEVRVERPIEPEKIEALEEGRVVLADGYHPLPVSVEIVEPTFIRITVFEGKYHLVKRLIAASGSKVLNLKRIAIGPIKLGNLLPGEWRMLSDDEVAELRRAIERSKGTERRP